MPVKSYSARRISMALAALLWLAPPPAFAQQPPPVKHDMAGMNMSGDTGMAMMPGPLGISQLRMGSGTSWLPDSTHMHAIHEMWGGWQTMLHGALFANYDDQGSSRGSQQFNVVNWGMIMLMKSLGTGPQAGMVHLHGMFSLEPATIPDGGYPLLLETGETYKGQPLHDRQHPHDAFMELAAILQQPVAKDLAVELYVGPVGEPALGPVAYMHRTAAENDPFAPIGHHWQDATHISFGVVTAGLYTHLWKLEGSAFNGSMPDENRWNLDPIRFDSYSGRLTVNPDGNLSLSTWYGYLANPEAMTPPMFMHHFGASLLASEPGFVGGEWATTLAWGANAMMGGPVEHSLLLESNLDLGPSNAVFGRLEYVQKDAMELVLPTASQLSPNEIFDVGSLVLGVVHEVVSIPHASIGLGVRGSVNLIPGTLEPYYGTRTPMGFAVYLRVRPTRMEKGHSMPGM